MADPRKFAETVQAILPGPVHLIELTGQLDVDATGPFDDRLKSLVAGGAKKFVLDFTHLKYVGSLGLRSLIGLANAVKGEGTVCVCGLSKDVKQVFEVTRVNMVLKVYGSRADALDAARSV